MEKFELSVEVVNPKNNLPLRKKDGVLIDADGNQFPVFKEIPRFVGANYAENFGFQWKQFRTTQIDNEKLSLSKERFFGETQWRPDELDGQDILEVGSGAGRFTRVILDNTRATLSSVDYSEAVDANIENNGSIDRERLKLFQASVYELPFPDNSFDKVVCLGVLQHTPDFEASVKALIAKAKPGGEIVVDFYRIKGWWTKVHSKYLLRIISKRIPHDRLLSLIERNIDWLVKAFDRLNKEGVGALTRFLPIADLRGFPTTLSPCERREWAILDTFDMLSARYDQPQRIQHVARMFERHGSKVTFAGTQAFEGGSATVVRATKVS